MANYNVTAERLRELLHYNPETGIFTRLTTVKGYKAGSIAGTDSHGYVCISIDGEKHGAHRLAWLYMHGYWPNEYIDHIDGIRSNNKFANLRDISQKANLQNERVARINSKSGLLGAYPLRNKWIAKIRVNGKYLRLGLFSTAEEAHLAYITAKRLHHEGCSI